MRAEDMQIAKCLEQGCSPEDTAEALGMELSVVQHRIIVVPMLGAIAARGGNEVTGRDVAQGGMDRLANDAVRSLQDLMLYGENENTRLRAAQFVLSRFVPEASGGGKSDAIPVKGKALTPEQQKAREERRKVMKLKAANANALGGQPASAVLVPLGDVINA